MLVLSDALLTAEFADGGVEALLTAKFAGG